MASTISERTVSTSGPVWNITYSVRNARRTVNASAATTTSVRMGSAARLVLETALALVGEELDREQPERESADVREVGDAPLGAGRVHEVEVAEHHLLDEPEAEDEERRQLEDREEEHDEDDRHHAGSREQQDVAAQHARHRARGADRGDRRVRPDEDLRGERGQAAQQVEEDELHAAHRV